MKTFIDNIMARFGYEPKRENIIRVDFFKNGEIKPYDNYTSSGPAFSISADLINKACDFAHVSITQKEV